MSRDTWSREFWVCFAVAMIAMVTSKVIAPLSIIAASLTMGVTVPAASHWLEKRRKAEVAKAERRT